MTGIRIDALEAATAVVFRRPILSRATLEQLAAVLDRTAASRRPLVLCSDHPRIFLAGADLQEISRLDPASARGYAEAGRRVLAHLCVHPAPVVAAVDGACTGGGFDLVMSCDRVVVGPSARFSHPGVRRGLVTGWGGTVTAPSTLGAAVTRRALLTAGELDADDAVRGGWAIGGGVAPMATALAEAARLAGLHPGRIATWRSLRAGNFVDRFRSVVVHNIGSRDPQSERESP